MLELKRNKVIKKVYSVDCIEKTGRESLQSKLEQ